MLSGNLYGKAAAFFLLVILLLLAMVMFRSSPRPERSGPGNRSPSSQDGDVVTFPPPYATEQEGLEDAIKTRKASARQLQPGVHEFTDKPVSGHQPDSWTFHKLPEEYFTPQSPETVRNAAESIKDLLEASSESEAKTRPATTAPAQAPEREATGP